MHFSGAILSLDGTQKIEISETRPLGDAQTLGEEMAQICLDQGAGGIIQEIKKQIGA